MATKEADSTELASTMKATPEQIRQAYAAILDGEAIGTYADPEVVSRAIVERIMQAESFDEAFRPQELTAWRDLLDVPVTVRSFHLNPSGYSEQGSSVYAVVDLVRMDDGETVTVTCGGRNVLAQLVKMLEAGWLGNPVKMIAKQTTEGYSALWLEAA